MTGVSWGFLLLLVVFFGASFYLGWMLSEESGSGRLGKSMAYGAVCTSGWNATLSAYSELYRACIGGGVNSSIGFPEAKPGDRL